MRLKPLPIAIGTNSHSNSNYHTGCGAVRLAHLLWEQGAAGSNPATPTLKIKELRRKL